MTQNQNAEPTNSTALQNAPQSTSAMAITGLVLGIIALVTSLIPIINNISFFIAILGLIFAIVGLVGTIRGKRNGKGLAIAGLVICIISIVAVLGSQALYSQAIDAVVEDATNGESATSTSTGETDYQNLSVGSAITLENDLEVCVNSVQTNLTNYDGSSVTCINVTYTNNGSEDASFNTYDWKGQDSSGVQSYNTYYSDSENDLSSGTLSAGGTVTGNVYFDGALTKVLYYNSMLSDSATAAWTVG